MTKSLTDCAEPIDEASEAEETTDRMSRCDDERGGTYGNGELMGSVLARMGATMGAHSLANGFSSTFSISSCSSWQSQAGSDTRRLPRTMPKSVGGFNKGHTRDGVDSPHSVCRLARFCISTGRACRVQ